MLCAIAFEDININATNINLIEIDLVIFLICLFDFTSYFKIASARTQQNCKGLIAILIFVLF